MKHLLEVEHFPATVGVQPRDQNNTQGYLNIYYVVAREFIINNSFTEEPSNSFIVGHPVEGVCGRIRCKYRIQTMGHGPRGVLHGNAHTQTFL